MAKNHPKDDKTLKSAIKKYIFFYGAMGEFTKGSVNSPRGLLWDKIDLDSVSFFLLVRQEGVFVYLKKCLQSLGK